MKRLFTFLTVLLLGVATVFAFADCTSSSWSNQDGSLHFLGRTYDYFGTLEANRISIVPSGYEYALNPEGSEETAAIRGVVTASDIRLAEATGDTGVPREDIRDDT